MPFIKGSAPSDTLTCAISTGDTKKADDALVVKAEVKPEVKAEVRQEAKQETKQ